jgi:hypothetical protein
MTAQTREILFYKGKIYHLATEPLKHPEYDQLKQNKFDFGFLLV